MTTIQANETIQNGLQSTFVDTYMAIENRVQETHLPLVMDLGFKAKNRVHEFAYFNSAPHMSYWRRGDTVPVDVMDSVGFTAVAHTYAKRIPWHKEDRKDDQTQSLFEAARYVGRSAAMLPTDFLADALNDAANTLPSIPLAPDGAALFSATTPDGEDRFGVSGGNLVAGGAGLWNSTAATISAVYEGIERFKGMTDTKGKPLWTDDILDQGFVVIYPHGRTQEIEEAFMQRRQGSAAGGAPSNIFMDASRDFTLWGTQRISTDHMYIFLKGSPKKPFFTMDREDLLELDSLEGSNNGDHTRTTGEEYIQFERRIGLGVALPYGVCEITDS